MKRLAGLMVLAMLFTAGLAVAADKPDVVHGNWEGQLTGPDAQGTMTAKVIALGDNSYKAILEANTDGETHTAELQGHGDGQVGVFWGKVEAGGSTMYITARALNGQMTGEVTGLDSPVAFKLNRVEKKSPTLGAPVPEGGVVIFDGTNEDKWKAVPDKWALGNGEMTVSRPSLITLDEYGSGTYHVEYKTPFMPNERGQGRGNSGVYVMGRYELQVLDSFGMPPAWDEAGGIYKEAVPKVNASLPPGEWQTYDITFTAAKFDESGKKIENARVTAKLNGILIHDNVSLSGPTPGGVSDQDAPKGPILLQNHGNSVSFRNIWFQPAAQ